MTAGVEMRRSEMRRSLLSFQRGLPDGLELMSALRSMEEETDTNIRSLTWDWDGEALSNVMESDDCPRCVPETLQSAEECFQCVSENTEYPFLLYLPPDFDARCRYPVILFLHGIGERGKEAFALADYGPFRYIRGGHALPFIVVAPVLEAEHHWVEDDRGEETDRQMIRLKRFLGQILDRCPIDHDRILLTGLSMGGRGAFKLACFLPDTFAAAAICCGRAAPREHPDRPHYDLSALKIPCWIFQGMEDTVVNPEHALAAARHLRRLHPNGRLRLTLYPHAGHNCYDFAYQDPGLYAWFGEQRKEGK